MMGVMDSTTETEGLDDRRAGRQEIGLGIPVVHHHGPNIENNPFEEIPIILAVMFGLEWLVSVALAARQRRLWPSLRFLLFRGEARVPSKHSRWTTELRNETRPIRRCAAATNTRSPSPRLLPQIHPPSFEVDTRLAAETAKIEAKAKAAAAAAATPPKPATPDQTSPPK